MKYKYLEHTADVKFRAYGKNLEEAFVNSAYAYADTISDHRKIEKRIDKKIQIEAEDEKALLYDYIEQLLYLLDTEDFLLAEIKEIKIEHKGKAWILFADITGDNQLSEYEIDTHIKAMTYQEMKIEKTTKGYMIQVVLDI